MNKGSICVKRLLTDRHFVISDDKADALWADIKDFWRQQDKDDPVQPENVPEGFTLEEMTCEPLIGEIEDSASGSLDTLPRECLLNAIALICGGVEWPVNGDSQLVRMKSHEKIRRGLAQRNIIRIVVNNKRT